ncbi:hypothetical protein QBC46DRAFT_278545 [Diplogelasinospora grovesii]|uniref:Mmc1 C-terminal domain-containing protein n=1 Tax=Diplogelasinospora grovesii TaxID=303347 RepID=A0AAN6NG61_9PEZI|nr:hypothetical protein QBC46DRAFT_278545 [Diplogelasinospora grovesii]
MQRALHLSLRQARWSRSTKASSSSSSVCLLCSLAKRPAQQQPSFRSRRGAGLLEPLITHRRESTTTTTTATHTAPSPEPAPSDPREDLQSALQDLQKHVTNYVNLSRVQLALRNLGQEPGNESVRVAFLPITNNGNGNGTTAVAKKLLKLVLADPLKSTEEWERQLDAHDARQPLLVRIERPQESQEESSGAAIAFAKKTDNLLPEIKVSSPMLNGSNLEILLMEVNPFVALQSTEETPALALEDAVLVPAVDIPTSYNTSAPITTPVHKALLVGNGIMGAASILSLPILEGGNTITAAVNLKKLATEGEDELSGCPFIPVDVDAAGKGLDLFRDSVGNAIQYETLWSQSNVSRVSEWFRTGVSSSEEGTTKVPVRNLIASLLQNARAAIQAEEARLLSSSLNAKVTPQAVAALNQRLSDWAQQAHEELQEQLDIAFTGKRWRKLGWWKLFWRVDDVGMLSSEMLAQRFLPESERSMIYLTGRIQESGITGEENGNGYAMYSGPVLPPPATDDGSRPEVTPELEGRWPTHIPYTRTYLLDKTIPALQALAQKLVVQSVSTSGLSVTLAVLSYISQFGAYESGAVAALGIVWSLRRLQKKWETARDFWEGEIREEGRKAIRASEASIAEVLDRSTKIKEEDVEAEQDLRRAEEIVLRAEDALARLK